MSNSDDIEAINNYMIAQESRAGDYPDIIPLLRNWRSWYADLGWVDKMQDSTLADAKAKRDAVKRIYNEAPPWVPADKEPAVYDPKTNQLDITVTAPSKKAGSTKTTVVSDYDAILKWQAIVGAPLTGVFDIATDTATKAWQSKYGITPDGIVGPITWQKAGIFQAMPLIQLTTRPPAREGDSPSTTYAQAVLIWQRLIKTTVDGQFGPTTEAATKTWQKNHGLVADGIVGKQSWNAAGYINAASMPVLKRTVAQVTPTTPVQPQKPKEASMIGGFPLWAQILTAGVVFGAIYKAYSERKGE